MKEEIERALQPLIGEPLSDMRRFVGIQAFEVGVQRPCKNHKGQDITRGEWRLQVGCYWRITGPEGYILSADDFGPGYSRRDQNAQPFYDKVGDAALIVEAIEADELGGVSIRLSEGYVIQVRCDEQNEEPDQEQWRFLREFDDENNFVITAQGIQQ